MRLFKASADALTCVARGIASGTDTPPCELKTPLPVHGRNENAQSILSMFTFGRCQNPKAIPLYALQSFYKYHAFLSFQSFVQNLYRDRYIAIRRIILKLRTKNTARKLGICNKWRRKPRCNAALTSIFAANLRAAIGFSL